jgi:hypothetical protein
MASEAGLPDCSEACLDGAKIKANAAAAAPSLTAGATASRKSFGRDRDARTDEAWLRELHLCVNKL